MLGPCSPKHGLARSTVLNNLFILMLNSLSRSLISMLGPCFPNQGPAHITVSNIFLILMLSSHSKTFRSMLRSYFPKHGPAHLTVLNNLFISVLSIFSRTLTFMFGPCSPTSRNTTQLSSLFQKSLRLVLKQPFKNVHFYAWTVLPQARPSLSHGIE